MYRSSPKLIYLLLQSERQLLTWMKAHTPKNFPSPTQAGALFLLAKQDGLSMGEIAEQLKLVPSAVSTLIDRMLQAGLVEKSVSTEDARIFVIHLTPYAKKLLPKLLEHTHKLNQQLLDGLTDEEIAIIQRWLNGLVRQFSTKPL